MNLKHASFSTTQFFEDCEQLHFRMDENTVGLSLAESDA